MKYSAGCELRCVNKGCLLKSSNDNATSERSVDKSSRVENIGNASIQLDGEVKHRQRKGDLIFQQDGVNEKKLTTEEDVMTETTATTKFDVTTMATPTTAMDGKLAAATAAAVDGRTRITMGRSMKDGRWKWTRSRKYRPRNVKQMIVINDSQRKKTTNQHSSRGKNIKKLCTAYRGLGIQKSFMCYSLKLYKLHG